jgi:MFS family permease
MRSPAGPEGAVRRNTLLLLVAQGCLYGTLPLLLIVGTVVIEELTGRELWIGVYTGTYFAAAAAGALLVGRLMDRVGRRPGLALGHALVAAGGLASALAVALGSANGLLAAAVPFGFGAGAALLGRGAVADMHPPRRRGRAVGLVLAASTLGAVGSPPLVAALKGLARGPLGMDPNVLPWFLIPVLEAVALGCVLALRPDPRDLAISAARPDEAVSGEHASPPDTVAARGPAQLLALAPFRAAVVAVAIGQAAMIAVMGAAPVVVHQHGGNTLEASTVISVHFLGMFAFAPAIGVVLDRWGRRLGLLAACVVSAAGALLCATVTGGPALGLGLFLVGLGWSAAYLGSTAVVSDLTVAAERAGALGFMDLLVSTSSGVGGLAGGIVLDVGGFGALGLAVAAVLAPVVVLVAPLREPTPGRWEVPLPARATP